MICKTRKNRPYRLFLIDFAKNEVLIYMSITDIRFKEQNFEYYTPKYLVDMFGPFDYDPCTTRSVAGVHGIPNFSTAYNSGLEQNWTKYKRIWINPPLYLAFPFLEKAISTYRQANNDIYFLAPVSILTKKKFHQIMDGQKIKLYIPNGRINFLRIHQEKEITPDFDSIIFKLYPQNEIKFFSIIIPGQHSILNETDV